MAWLGDGGRTPRMDQVTVVGGTALSGAPCSDVEEDAVLSAQLKRQHIRKRVCEREDAVLSWVPRPAQETARWEIDMV